MYIESPFSGAVRDIKIIDLNKIPIPLTTIIDRINNSVEASNFNGIDSIDIDNMPNNACEYRINYERGRGFKVSVNLNVPYPFAGNLLEDVPYKSLILIAPYSMPKGKYYIIGDMQQPVLLNDFNSKTGSKFTDLHNEEMQFNITLKNLPPTVSFLG